MKQILMTFLTLAVCSVPAVVRAEGSTVVFQLRCDAGGCEALAKALTEQLQKRAAVFGLKGLEVTHVEARRVVVQVPNEPGAEEVIRRPGRLEVYRVDDSEETWARLAELPAGVRLDTWGGIKGRYRALVSDDEGALHAAMQGRLPDGRFPGTSFELAKATGRLEFTAVVMYTTPLFESGAIATAKALVPEDGGIPGVLVELTAAAGKDFEAATAKVLGLRLAMVVDGDVVHTPKVREPITGGTIRISKCNWRVDLAASVLARAYAAVLAAPYPDGAVVEQ